MRVFKWSSTFYVARESSIVPIWVSLPRLPVHFSEKNALFTICSLIGCPLQIDSATSSLKRPSTARTQIEIDWLKERPLKIWIETEGKDGFWQKLDYENVPDYCQTCWHVGHSDTQCTFNNPRLKLKDNRSSAPQSDKEATLQHVKQVYIPKHSISVSSAPIPVAA